MDSFSQSNKRIATNTILLYFRMFVIMAVNLYASRVILQTLGVSDYGLYNVVAGFVSLFTFANSTLTAGTQRFLSYSLGKGEEDYIVRVFNTAFCIHLLFAILFGLFIEPIGIWYISDYMNIPSGREDAALWVFNFSVLSMMVNIIQVPFNAAITSHERFNIYAYMSIYDGSMKLFIVYLLQISSIDKLILYSILYFVVTLSTATIYNLYCRKNIKDCKIALKSGFDKGVFKEIGVFSGWNTIGSIASLSSGQGVNLVINFFLGTIINASRGISVQVASVVNQFVSNFMSAVNPQLVKLYAERNISDMYKLGQNASKYGAILMLCICVPFIVEMDYVLKLWLGEVPVHTAVFTSLSLIQAIVTALYTPLVTMLHATGRMKYPNIFCGTILMLIVPITYILLRYNVNIDTVIAINILPWVCSLFVSLYLLHRYIGIEISKFLINVIFRVLAIAAINFPFTVLISSFMSQSFLRLTIVTICSVCITALLTYVLGLDKVYRNKINHLIIKKIK